MRTIIKYFIPDRTWSVMFLIEELPIGNVITIGGFISSPMFEHLHKQYMLREIDAVEIIDKYFLCAALITDAKSFKYFELKSV